MSQRSPCGSLPFFEALHSALCLFQCNFWHCASQYLQASVSEVYGDVIYILMAYLAIPHPVHCFSAALGPPHQAHSLSTTCFPVLV